MNRFALGIGWRIAAITLLSGAMVWLYVQQTNYLIPGALVIVHFTCCINLYRYTTGMNRKLARFMESVRYSDFAVAFRADSTLGPSFQHLNAQFNEVLGAFRQARSEKEASLHYVNTIVQHVSVGLLTFDGAGQVELVNQTALRLLGIYRLRTLNDLAASHPGLPELLQSGSGTPVVYQAGKGNELSVRGTAVRLRGRLVTVASLQNIRTELQQRELLAWQNLTKVLRHEIMNSITPIVSLAGTMRDIVEIDLMGGGVGAAGEGNGIADSSPLNDLRDALLTIEQRGGSVMAFVDAYRHFTTIPQPVLATVAVPKLLNRVAQLTQVSAQQQGISLTVQAPELTILADAGQLEMVLLNLLKNAIESLTDTSDPAIRLDAVGENGQVIIRVADNGPGIEPEAMEQIFIPFYTTKKTGSGIGLSLSRQIMQFHNGQLTVQSAPGRGSVFQLIF